MKWLLVIGVLFVALPAAAQPRAAVRRRDALRRRPRRVVGLARDDADRRGEPDRNQ